MSLQLNCISRGRDFLTRHKLVASFVICLFFTAIFPGDASAQLFKFGRKKDPLPVVFNRTPTQAELVQHITNNNSKFRQLSSDLVVSLDGTPKLRGTMQLELPRRLRIKAGVMGVSQFGVDVGSNNQDFWVWTKVNLPNQKPAIFHSSHEGFKNANSRVKQAIPMEPVWLLEGLGLVQFERGDVHIGPNITPEGFLRLITVRQTAGRQTARATLVHAKNGTIVQQALYVRQTPQREQTISEGPPWSRIAYTNSTEYKYFPKKGAALPEKIEMYLTQNGQETKMVIEASDFQFDALYGDPNQMWSMPTPKGVQAIDMSKLR